MSIRKTEQTTLSIGQKARLFAILSTITLFLGMGLPLILADVYEFFHFSYPRVARIVYVILICNVFCVFGIELHKLRTYSWLHIAVELNRTGIIQYLGSGEIKRGKWSELLPPTKNTLHEFWFKDGTAMKFAYEYHPKLFAHVLMKGLDINENDANIRSVLKLHKQSVCCALHKREK